jgi:glycerol-3-phosphate dehydrogenase
MKEYDIVVIGGGIHGVGVAQAAAARGYKILLLEQTSLAAGTSSKSSKLIHGGLRYLESAQFSLVKESICERTILFNIAPDLVKPVKFYLPVYKNTSRSAFYIGLGLAIYALLGRFSAYARFRLVPKKHWNRLNNLKLDDLEHVFQYWDGQTNDKRLTESVMNSALSLGADIACPARFSQAHKLSSGYEVTYKQNEQQLNCKTKVLVNAAGPWVNSVLDYISPVTSKRQVDLVQGAHVVIKQAAPSGIFYVEAPQDKRVVFMMPWQGNTLIGTTESMFTGNPSDVKPAQREIDYLLDVARHYFPGWQLDEISRFAGLRVLPRNEASTFKTTRETILHQTPSHPGLFSIYGGKLTGYRATAEKLLKLISRQYPAPVAGKKIKTEELPLSL